MRNPASLHLFFFSQKFPTSGSQVLKSVVCLCVPETSDESAIRMYSVATHSVAVVTQFIKSCEYYLKAFLSFFAIFFILL